MTNDLKNILRMAASQKMLLDAKLDEFGAYAAMRNIASMNLAREQAHTLLDAFCDTTDAGMIEIRKGEFE